MAESERFCLSYDLLNGFFRFRVNIISLEEKVNNKRIRNVIENDRLNNKIFFYRSNVILKAIKSPKGS